MGDGDDLTARVERLEAAVAAAGASLVGVSSSVPPPGRSHRAGTPTSATKKGVRTVLQVGLASIPGLGLAALTKNAVFMWVATFVLTPIVTYVQNETEDRAKKGFLRDFGSDEPPTHHTGTNLAP